MSNLVYKLVKTYGDGFSPSNVNYLCKDNYIHIRLDKFGAKPQHINGFEGKLTFLLTLLMQEKSKEIVYISQIDEWKDKAQYQKRWKECLEHLKSTKEYKDIEYVLKNTFDNFKGIKILPRYSLKHKPESAFDLLGGCDNLFNKDMSYILDCFKYDFMDIVEFLFDNNLEIYIEKVNKVDDSKYINKYKEKEDVGPNLWEE